MHQDPSDPGVKAQSQETERVAVWFVDVLNIKYKNMQNVKPPDFFHGWKKSALGGTPDVTSTAPTPPALTLVWMGCEDSETQRTGL